ncbi:hypothetical protein BVG79_01823 [Ketogulonicigenium robustum]|uniref:Uncharacterized protein n=1 Tax=Ketogulonicigenium robustum TaxID=92947 RepID=A0A1W6P1K2_9RHOB|nr:hypothetical protein BVG79_01823 [Ketogulonicigenium robustum]
MGIATYFWGPVGYYMQRRCAGAKRMTSWRESPMQFFNE